MAINPAAVNLAKKPFELLSISTLKKAWVIFSITMFALFFLGTFIETGKNIYNNGLKLSSVEPLWSELLLPIVGMGAYSYDVAESIKANGGHLPIVKPEYVEKEGAIANAINNIWYNIKVFYLYAAFILMKIIAPLIFPYWILRGLYRWSPILFSNTFEGSKKAYLLPITIYLILLVIGGNISLLMLDDNIKLSGKEAMKYEYRSIYGYYDLASLLWSSKGESTYKNVALNSVKKETGVFINGTNLS